MNLLPLVTEFCSCDRPVPPFACQTTAAAYYLLLKNQPATDPAPQDNSQYQLGSAGAALQSFGQRETVGIIGYHHLPPEQRR